jgi:L-aspartate oxidase
MSPAIPLTVRNSEVLVIGSGLAGMTVALRLAPRRVTLLTKTADLPGGSTFHAQGGIAVALAPGDDARAHAADTVAAGAGLVDAAMADLLTAEGRERIAELIADGMPFDRDANGDLSFGREAAHGAARVIHSGGDATGRNVSLALADRVRNAPSVAVETDSFVVDLVARGGRVQGALAFGPDGWVFHRAAHVVLATGGIGQVFARTTNPVEATGDGLALAARAGAVLADVEFVQFHPTALVVPGDGTKPASLMTEALRGAGATLLDGDGERFMPDEHPLAELAPRDVVARAIGKRIAAGEPVYLDMRPALAAKPDGFPTCLALCAEAGLDPRREPVPVGPAAHYHMGGVKTDAEGRTSLKGLWACGETACTGVHGANRLASNSLLEALVFGARVADAIAEAPAAPRGPVAVPLPPSVPGGEAAGVLDAVAATARRTLYTHAGLVRDEGGLRAARRELERLEHEIDVLPAGAADAETIRRWGEARNRLLVGRLVVFGALNRLESRGAHTRLDHPLPAPDSGHSVFTLDALAKKPAVPALGEFACPTL